MLTPEKQAKRFAGMVNCPIDNSQAMVECLRSKPAEELVVVHREILVSRSRANSHLYDKTQLPRVDLNIS